jgi:hypothetical protein
MALLSTGAQNEQKSCEITNKATFKPKPSCKLFTAVTTITEADLLDAYDFKLKNRLTCKFLGIYFIPERDKNTLIIADCDKCMTLLKEFEPLCYQKT